MQAVVTLTGVLLTLVVLITQNRQLHLAEQRAQLTCTSISSRSKGRQAGLADRGAAARLDLELGLAVFDFLLASRSAGRRHTFVTASNTAAGHFGTFFSV